MRIAQQIKQTTNLLEFEKRVMEEQLLMEHEHNDIHGTAKNDVLVATLRAGPTRSPEDQARALMKKGVENVTRFA